MKPDPTSHFSQPAHVVLILHMLKALSSKNSKELDKGQRTADNLVDDEHVSVVTRMQAIWAS
jgi:hypothetical protein